MAAPAKLRPAEVAVMLAVSAAMIAASYWHWWPMPLTEVLGFVTGGACVWLVVREHLWNWPVGLANNVFFFVLFFESRLYADMSLQVVYFVMGVYGWIHWRFGGAQRSELPISRTTRAEWLALVAAIPLATFALREVLLRVNGAAPFWDSLTTVLSLAAQYLLCQKRIENWFIWIAADLIYIPLYFSRHLPLTAVLYMVLLTMCVIGQAQWRSHLAPARLPA
jgi:nicotinamide mononucleotide transporter